MESRNTADSLFSGDSAAPANERRKSLVASMLASFARLISGAHVRWIDCKPETRQRIYFANHTSHLDFVVLWSALPPEVRSLTRPVAARDYWERGRIRLRLVSEVFNGVLIDRAYSGPPDPKAMADSARKTIEQVSQAFLPNHSLIIFPEGTRGTGEKVGVFKSGLFHLCSIRPDVELVPVYLENLNRILPKGVILPVPLLSSVTFGPPMTFNPSEPKNDFLTRMRDAVCRLKPE